MNGIGIKVVGIGTVGNNVLNKMVEKEIAEVSDTVIVLPLKKLVKAYSSATFDKLFEKRDEIFIKNVEFITNLITKQGIVNLDLDDVKIMLGNSGEGVTAFGKGEGQDKVKLATEQIINSPFIKNLPKARKILLSITAGPDIGLTDLQEVAMIINEKFGADQTNMLWGYIMDAELEDKIEVEMLITDFSK